VIPCHNEATRLDSVALIDEEPALDLLFVDDGSLDATRQLLQGLAAARPERMRVLALAQNVGKGEAVRRGLLQALCGSAAIVGYFDADLATPPSEIRRLLAVMGPSAADLLLGSRVALLGRNIDRKQLRHYLGRAFASAASAVLDLPVYDTQCGAKLMLRGPALDEALREPFVSRWVFDVELIGRLLAAERRYGALRIVEEPLLAWRDVPGSKLRPAHVLGAATDLARIARDLRTR
jgi:dolichyl-phosphate beta-glucosyltransferase